MRVFGDEAPLVKCSYTSKKRFQGGAWGLRPAISGHSLSNGQEHGQIGQNHENRHLQVAVRGRWCLKVRGPTPKLLLIDLKTCSNTDFIARGKLEWYRFVELKRPKRNTYCGAKISDPKIQGGKIFRNSPDWECVIRIPREILKILICWML